MRSTKNRRVLNLERLEGRQLMAADWQNASLPCDVDHSATVTPLDVLLLINSINRDGDRTLGTRSDTTKPYYDVNGDSQLTILDVLRVINSINRAMPELGVTTALPTSLDSDLNGVVAGDTFVFEGQTGPLSKIDIVVKDDTETLSKTFRVTSDVDGRFSATVPLSKGLNRLLIHVVDEIGNQVDYVGQMRRGNLISQWNASMLNVLRTLGSATANAWTEAQAVMVKPPGAARNLAMIYGAMFDAINAVQGGYQGFVYQGTQQSGADAVAAGTTAAYQVAVALYPDSASLQILNATLNETLAGVAQGEPRRLGILLGQSIASAVLQSRSNDGSATNVDRVYSSAPGKWKPEAPVFEDVLPQWPQVRPFVITAGDAFRPAAPPTLSSAEYAQAVDQVMQIGRKDSSTRTTEQTNIALFWADGAGTATPPGHWNQIAADLLARNSMSLVEQSRVMAMLNLAMADAGIASWDSKYEYDYWRPIEAIHRAAEDQNAATTADTSWQPLIKTPPFPSYVSGHSSFSGAASQVLTTLLGATVRFPSQMDSRNSWGVTKTTQVANLDRYYSSFQAAADEAGMSRIYGGIHYSFDNTVGLNLGHDVGAYVVTHALQPKT